MRTPPPNLCEDGGAVDPRPTEGGVGLMAGTAAVAGEPISTDVEALTGTVDAPPVKALYTDPWSLRKVLGLLAVFGPAAVVASLSIGAGETIVVVREGAWAGYGRLWLVLLSVLTKGIFLTYLLGRYTAVSGENLGSRLVRLPGPRGWFLIFFVALEVLAAPLAWVPMAKPCGDLIHFVLRGFLPAGIAEPVWENLFTTVFILAAVTLGIGLSFQTIEKQQIWICGILVAGTFAGTMMVRPDLWQALLGTFSIGHLPPPPPWAPEAAHRQPWLMTATTFAYVGGSVMSYLAYANWVGMHGWGMAGHPRIEAIKRHAASRDKLDYLPEQGEEVRRLRQSLQPLRWDVGMGGFVLFFVTAAFMISGAAVLFPLQSRFEGWSLLTNQADIWRQIHPALVWVYYVCIAAAMWGTLQSLPEVYGRVTQEFAAAIWPERKWDFKTIQIVVCAYIFVVAMALVWLNVPFDLLTQIAGFLLANLGTACAMVAALYLNFKLPPACRTRGIILAGAVLSALLLIVFSFISGWGLFARLVGV